MLVTRIFTGDDGESHFEDIDVEKGIWNPVCGD